MYSFNLRKKNFRNPIKLGLFKIKNNINSSNPLNTPIISRIYKQHYQCGGCGRK